MGRVQQLIDYPPAPIRYPEEAFSNFPLEKLPKKSPIFGIIASWLTLKDQCSLFRTSKTLRAVKESADQIQRDEALKFSGIYRKVAERAPRSLKNPKRWEWIATRVDTLLRKYSSPLETEIWINEFLRIQPARIEPPLSSPINLKKLTVFEKIEMGNLISEKRGTALVNLFVELAPHSPEVSTFLNGLPEALSNRIRAQHMRAWLGENPAFLERGDLISLIDLKDFPPETLRFKNLPEDALAKIRQAAFKMGNYETAETILHSFPLAIEAREEALRLSAHHFHSEILKMLLAYNWATEISPETLGRTLIEASSLEDVQLILSHDRAHQIPVQHREQALLNICRVRETFEWLLDADRGYNTQISNHSDLLRKIIDRGVNVEWVLGLIKKNNNFSKEYALRLAAGIRNPELMQKLLETEPFSADAIGSALVDACISGHLEGVRQLTVSPQFPQIHPLVIKKALTQSSLWGFRNIIQILINMGVGARLDDDFLSEIVDCYGDLTARFGGQEKAEGQLLLIREWIQAELFDFVTTEQFFSLLVFTSLYVKEAERLLKASKTYRKRFDCCTRIQIFIAQPIIKMIYREPSLTN